MPPELLKTEIVPPAEDAVFVLPASFAQRRLWFLDQLEPGGALYNVPLALRLAGELDAGALEGALGAIVERHEVLRTTFAVEDDEVVQVVSPRPEGAWEFASAALDAVPAGRRAGEARRRVDAFARRPFDLERGPLFRALLLRLGESEHVLALALHHAVVDGASIAVLFEELRAFYDAAVAGAAPELPELPIQYGDFAVWQQEELAGETGEAQLAYWQRRLRGAPRRLELALTRPCGGEPGHVGGRCTRPLPAALATAADALAGRHGASRFMVLLAAFAALLVRHGAAPDVVVGTPVAGRQQIETENLIGLFVNLLALRTTLADAPDFAALVERVRGVVLDGLAHQDLPFEQLVETLDVERALSRQPLVQVIFSVIEHAPQVPRLVGLAAERLPVELGLVKLDLGFTVEDTGRGWLARVDFRRDLYEGDAMERLLASFETLLAAALAAPGHAVAALPVLPPALRHQVLAEWNDRHSSPPRRSLAALFAARAAAAPDAVAVATAAAVAAVELTYGELDRRAERLARYLRALGVGPRAPLVGLCMERSIEQIVALVAILKAGGAYLPLDPAYPRERLALMFDDGGVEVLIAHRQLLGELPADLLAARQTRIVHPEDELPAAPAAPAPAAEEADALAYVVYTSGSTGRPKGVAVGQRAVVRLVLGTDFIRFGPAERYLQLAPVAFDASTLELWGSLLNGARLVVFPPHTPSLHELASVLRADGISTLWLTAGLFHQMVDEELPSLLGVRQLLAGGEALSAPHVRRVLAELPAGHRLVNGYGPTENTTFTTTHAMAGGERVADSVPLGRPIAGGRAHVLDRGLEPVPVGVAGELLMGGAGLARGYLERPALTAESFVPDPLAATPGERLYRSGDLVRYRADGTLDFLGRLDHQLKLRGFRVEPGEIETRLTEHPAVRNAAVLVAGGDGGRQLVAYLVTDSPPADVELRRHLEERLPAFMVPAVFVHLRELPLNPNGKVDRAALARQALPEPVPEAGDAFVAPRGPHEELVAAVWREVLGLPAVGAHDDFFALGGHSLKATQVVSRLRRMSGAELPVRAIFEHPTVARLAARLAGTRGTGAAPPITPVPRDVLPPASFAQERLWFLDRFESDRTVYNVPAAQRLAGPLAAGALAAALSALARRHESLRTVFESVDDFESAGGGVAQVVEPPAPVPLPLVELGALSAARRVAETRRLARRAARRPFDLARGPLWRALLVRLAGDDHVLLLTLHHVVSDGWSMGVLWRELDALYGAALAGEPPPLAPLPIHYADFAAWQRRWLSGAELERQLGYWRRRLEGLPPVLELPLDRPRPAAQTSRGGEVAGRLTAAETAAVKQLAGDQGASLFMVLLAAFQALLGRLSGQRDLAVGTPIANRNREETEGLIGFFVNTLVLRADLGGDPGFAELVARTRETALDAFAHQDLPFEKLVGELVERRDLSHPPLVQVLFVLQNAPPAAARLGDLERSPFALGGATARLDLTLAFIEDGEALRFGVEHNRDLFDATTMRRWTDQLRTLLAAATGDPERPWSRLPLATAGERQQVLVEWNADAVPAPARTLHGLCGEQAARTPEAVALAAGGERLSYRELARRAHRLAGRLRALGVGPEVRVGVCLERSADLVVTLLAVLEAGGAYVPLDPTYPLARLDAILDDATSGTRISAVVTRSAFLERLPRCGISTGLRAVLLDRDAPAPAAPEGAPPASPASLAYLIYTSGSTGRPKGVAITHANAAALVDWAHTVFTPGELARVLGATSINFDLSVFEIFVTLAAGGTLVLADDALALAETAAASEVTLVNTVPSAMAELARLEALPPSVRTVNLAGEPLKRRLADAVLATRPGCRLYNLYGPSEDTTYSTFTRVAAGDAEPTIGRPLAGTRAYVLDRALQPVPVGVAGELALGGRGLARGYLRRPALTAATFVPDPFAATDDERLYRTGDLARWRPGGELEFLGRIDHQVKVRGFRVELGEVEAHLARHPSVDDAVAAVRREGGDPHLVAYVVGEAEPAELRRHLAAALPEYMVPAVFVRLDALPHTTTGKVDRKRLPAPRLEHTGAGAFVAPRGPHEALVAEVWREVLGREAGAHDDFFALGGHSLKATRVVSRLRRVSGGELSVRALFEAPTVAELAARLAEARGARAAPPIERAARTAPLPASFAQERLWFLDRFDSDRTVYNMPAAQRLAGRLEVAALAGALAALARRHEVLRTVFAEVDDGVLQVVQPPAPVALPGVDLGALPPSRRETEARRLARREARRPFDLAQGPLWRSVLLRLAGAEHVLLLTLHHVAGDGWSMGVLWHELAALYSAALTGEPSPLAPLPIQYADFAAWQRRRLAGAELERQLGYWRRRLEGLPPVLELPLDRPRPAVQTNRGAQVKARVPVVETAALQELAHAHGASLFMVLLAGFQAMLGRVTGRSDVPVGTPIANRNQVETEGLIGLFVNTLVLRGDLSGAGSFAELLARTRETTLEAYAHQDLPFEKLVGELFQQRDLSHAPLVQVMLALQNVPASPPALEGLESRPFPTAQETSRVDLTLMLAEREGGLEALAEHNRDLFDTTTIRRLVARLRVVLAAAAREPAAPLSRLPLLAAGERQQMLREWNDRRRSYPRRSIAALFAVRAAAAPDTVAVAMASATGTAAQLTYGELDRRASHLAGRLRSLGVSRAAPLVGLCMERSLEQIVALVAILKAGGAYLPLDPAYPRERLALMLDDGGVEVLIGHEHLLGELPADLLSATRCVAVDRGLPAGTPAATPGHDDPEALAYVVYTSGSTGRPKGVAVAQKSVVRLVQGTGFIRFGPAERYLQLAPVAFDASTLELWGSLLNGARLVVFPPHTPSLHELGEVLRTDRITTLWLTAGLFNQMVGEELPSLLGVRQVLAGGEALSVPHVRRVLAELPAGHRLINGYGPTENTTFTTTHAMAPGERLAESVPLGRPISNGYVHLLDRNLEPAPIGVPGELCMGGAGLARGYLERPALTAERFVPAPPFGDPKSAPGERLYRSGDLVRYRADGTIDFLGRLDDQVKLRGFRVEPGEIEARLAEHPAVRDAVVLVEGGGADRRLVACVVERRPAKDADLRRFLEERLPAFMVPAVFLRLPELPLNPNGKVDRTALARLAPAAASPQTSRAFVAPRGPREELVAEVWREVLGVTAIGVHDDFFALGGHSLSATQVVSRLRRVAGVEVPVRAVFEASTVARLATRLEAARRETLPPIVPAPRDAPPPASFAQERLWFLDRLGVDPVAYNLPMAFRLRGPLDADALAAALAEIVRRHEALRTRFADGELGVVQIVEPAGAPALPVIDLSALPAAARERGVRRLVRSEARRPFDLGRAPMQRATLVRLRYGDEHALLVTQHHVASDGWSIGVWLRELRELYAAFARGERRSPLPPLPVQYGDFAAWQRSWLRGEHLAAEVEHWRQRLAGAPALLELPTDRPRPAFQSFRGAHVRFAIPADLARELRALARDHGVTTFMTLTAAYQTLLARYAGTTVVPVGTPVAGRNHSEIEGLIGFFVNTLVLAGDLGGDPRFSELLARTRETALDAYAHQDVPFEKLVEALELRRNLSHAPLFQVVLNLENTPPAAFELTGLEVESLTSASGTAKFDLNLALRETGDRLHGEVEYPPALFDATTVARLVRHFEALLAAVAADPERPLSSVPLLSPAERFTALTEWNDTAVTFPEHESPEHDCLHTLFARRAARAPHALAVVGAGAALTYGELDRRAHRLACRLRALGVRPGRLVGVHLERGSALVVAVLAVLEAGGAYVPLETTWPAARLRYIVERHGVDRVVTESALLKPLAEIPGIAETVCVDDGETDGSHAPLASDPRVGGLRATPDDLAYVIFTSGSTGRPKGVVVRHRPAVNLVCWVNRTFGVGPGDRLFFVTALSFDLSVYDVFGVLAAGGTVRVASAAELRDPQRQIEVLRREPITFWNSAPAALQQLAPFFPEAGTPTALSRVFLSGDWIPVALPGRVRAAFRHAEVVSLGGATEATVWSNFHRVGEVDPQWTSIPYGRPIANARYHVLDARLEPCPIGVAGDLYIGGACLSDGYANEPVLTARAYQPDPFSARGRLYRTGDRARRWADGTLEFLGRLDTQVKVRGFRIELGEIETVLASHPGVDEAVALAREDVPGDQRLVAYFITARQPAPAAAELRELARARLPEYMVPSAFVELEAWPLAATGKLDRAALGRKALPSPAAAGREAPRGDLERAIAAVWREVIGIAAVDPRDNFFEVGGHSLLMARIHARLGEELGREVPLVDLFRFPTVRSLAEHLSPRRHGETAPETPARPAARDDAIAVVGMAGRFPGAPDLDAFWRNVAAGVESIRVFSDEELAAAGFDARALDDPSVVKARGALDGPELFDAAFFGYSPREAQIMDPQQRHFLEVAWSALEHAGYGAAAGRRRVGVFAGASENTYVHELLADGELVRTVGRQQVSIANNPDYLATRVAYKLDLEGPSVAVQTACSTSLVAVHLACRGLQAGDCDLALAGGASVSAREVAPYRYHEGGIASPDGHTRAFDARAGGVVAGSGVAAVALKRLADAEADGDTVHAVIRGSAINNDGARKVGFTAPSADGQARAIADALRVADVDPRTLDYVEAHGTGTPVGDPIEIAGLRQAFAEVTAAGNGGGAELEAGRCALGSVKTNVGHLDAAAGAAGLIKTVLALRHRQIPPSLHFERPNPALELAGSPFFVNTELRPWKRNGAPRRAGVSAFGIGGTNAHLILEESPQQRTVPPRREVQLLPLSARTESALARAAADLADHLEAHPELALADAAYTLQVGRERFDHRRAVVARSREQAIAELRAPRAGVEARGDAPAVVFQFPGQGAQFVGMTAELYGGEPLFRGVIDRCAELAAPLLEHDLRELLYAEADDAAAAALLRRTDHAQVALFAVEAALAELWKSWGVRPAAMIGHSLGELAAAHLAGVFPLADALGLVARRGRLMRAQPPGDMLAVGLPEGDVRAFLETRGGELELAAVNAPAACVVAGPAAAIGDAARRLAERGVEAKRLHTSHAFHSTAMEAVLEPFAAAFEGLEPAPPEVPWASNLTGAWITADEAADPGYWCRHLRHPVRYADGLAAVLALERPVLLEVGPGRGLSTLARQHPQIAAAAAVTPSLRHPRDAASDLERLLAAAGALWTSGGELDWTAFHGEPRHRVPLPTYPFERQPYWLDSRAPAPAGGKETTGRGPSSELSGDEEKIAAVWRELLGVEQVAADDDFFELGGSSLMAVQLAARLRRALDVELPSDFLLEASTPGDLAALAAARRAPDAGTAETSCLVRLRRGGDSRAPLFMVHQVGGHVYTYRALGRLLGAGQALYGLRSRGLEAGEEPLARVEDMAALYLERVREVRSRGPYQIGGASMGGVVAYEMARQLSAAGESVALLTMMDTPGPGQLPERPADEAELVAAVFAGQVPLERGELAGRGAEEQLDYALDKARRRGLELDPAECRRRREVLRGNVEALFAYRPRPWDGRLLFFRAEERRHADPPRPELAWLPLAAGAEVLLVPGDHETMHAPPNVEPMARALEERLERFANGG